MIDKLLRILIIFCLSPVFIFSQRLQEPSVVKLTKYVTDEAGILSTAQLISLETKLSRFEKETSNQVVVYIIRSLEGESLEEKSYEIAEKNKIGQKEKDNGVLLFIVINDRKLRIEVGYGLEGALPDALCNQIIRKEITPYFKQSKYYEGINAGVDAIINATKGEYKQDKTESSKDDKEFGVGVCGIPILVVIIFFFFGIFFVFSILRRIFGWRRGGRSGWWYTGGSSLGSGSSWSSGSSGYSGGFSGGGGSFGGGGASGSW